MALAERAGDLLAERLDERRNRPPQAATLSRPLQRAPAGLLFQETLYGKVTIERGPDAGREVALTVRLRAEQVPASGLTSAAAVAFALDGSLHLAALAHETACEGLLPSRRNGERTRPTGLLSRRSR
jgi:hypothetical protein